jgi:predicted transcriptional regulator
LLKSSEEKDKIFYEITDKGKHFLSEFQRMEAFVNGFGLDI